ncbi:MAG: hypothetical protein IIW73_07530 [Clostridia bacterium]|nr:hypothetical protein [Clostridia bacterium]
MKRIILLEICLIMMLTLVSCGNDANNSLDEVMDELNGANASSIDETESDVSSEITLTAAEIVKREYEKSGEYLFNGTKTEFNYAYPQIVLDQMGVTSINERIKNYCEALIDTELNAMKSNRKLGMTKMSYSAYLKGEILSILIKSEYGYEFTLFEAINLNILTGIEQEKDDIFNAAGLTTTDAAEKIKTAAEDKYVQIHGTIADRDVDDTIDYAKGKSATSIDYDVDMTLYFDEDGNLKAIVRIYKLGGEEYEYHEVMVK